MLPDMSPVTVDLTISSVFVQVGIRVLLNKLGKEQSVISIILLVLNQLQVTISEPLSRFLCYNYLHKNCTKTKHYYEKILYIT